MRQDQNGSVASRAKKIFQLDAFWVSEGCFLELKMIEASPREDAGFY